MSRTSSGAEAPEVTTPATNGHADTTSSVLRRHAEEQFAEELEALARSDTKPRPPRWRLSPWAVATYLLGGTLDDGFVITPKYIGNRRLMEVAVATLATDRALLLLGVPGTAKSWVSEHIAAAIAGDSTMLVQGTAGTSEEAIRYGWNYALLLAEGPTHKALVPSPLMRAMTEGKIARVEELTRIPADVQDTLITILSEKTLPIPELNSEVQAAKGFNLIATANNRDKGVNELSSALKRRFNTVVLPHARDGRRRGHNRPDPGRGARPGPGLPGRAAGPGGDPAGRHDLPRAPRRPDGRRQGEGQAAQRHDEHGRGDLGRQPGPRPGRALRRRRDARLRHGLGPRRRGRQGPCAGSRRVARIPGNGRQGARRLEGPVPGLPGGRLS